MRLADRPVALKVDLRLRQAVADILDLSELVDPPAHWRSVLVLGDVVDGLQRLGVVLPRLRRGESIETGRPMSEAEQRMVGLVSDDVPD